MPEAEILKMGESYVISINIFWRNVEEAAILAFSERKANALQSIHFILTNIGLRASCSRFAIVLNFFKSNLLLKG